MTKMIIMRHGESLANMDGKFVGHTNLDLSPTGYRQAEIAKDYLKNQKIDVIYSSDLQRAYNTVKPTADCIGMSIKTTQNLREIFGGEWENKTEDEIVLHYAKEYEIWKNDMGNSRCTNGESVHELFDRVCTEIEKIAKENDGKTVLVATHAAVIKCMLTKWNNLTLVDIKNAECVANASLTFADYENGVFKITKKDYTDHLGDTVTRPTV